MALARCLPRLLHLHLHPCRRRLQQSQRQWWLPRLQRLTLTATMDSAPSCHGMPVMMWELACSCLKAARLLQIPQRQALLMLMRMRMLSQLPLLQPLLQFPHPRRWLCPQRLQLQFLE